MATTLEQEFEAATPTAAIQADWDSARPTEKPSNLAVTGNAVIKGLAAIPDAVLNTPVNAWNLLKMAFGTAAGVAGRPDITADVELTPSPNLVNRALHNPPVQIGGETPLGTGLIQEKNEPQTPGQRVLDAAVQTGTGMVVIPGQTVGQVAKNVIVGGVTGAAAQATKEVTGSTAAAVGVALVTPLALQQANRLISTTSSLNTPTRNLTLKDAQDAGYKVAPSSVNPSFVNNRLESLAGKAAVKQEAGIQNQAVTNTLAGKALGLPDGTPITEGTLQTYRKVMAAPYEQVSQMSPLAASALEKLKAARHEANLYFRHYDRSGDPASLKQAESQAAFAKSYETVLEKIALKNGQPALLKDLRAARQAIAKSYDVERALNVGDGNVSALVLGRLLDKGKPLSGELLTTARFAQAFPQVAREGAMIPSAGVSGTDPAMAAILASSGYGLAGPAGLLAGGLPLVRGPARKLALSDFYQEHMAQPGVPLSLGDVALKSALAGRTIAEKQP